MNSKEATRTHVRSTQADIAARVGISRATVSAAISGTRYVSPDLKAQILQTAEDLHYVPDIVARSMKTNRTMTIGLVLPNILSPVWATIAVGLPMWRAHRGSAPSCTTPTSSVMSCKAPYATCGNDAWMAFYWRHVVNPPPKR